MITLSIGIPTYQRPALLKRLITSIIDQKEISEYNIEILIGDDSPKSVYTDIEDVISMLPANVSLKYEHHIPSKGQNENVGYLIEKAKGEYFCLMHDDDYFLEESISTLLREAQKNLNCIVFGKQLFFSNEYDYKSSDKVNDDFKRSASFKGKQKDSVAMAMLQQCPNDGFILPTTSAKSLGSRPASIIGTACDFDFALRAAAIEKLGFYFIDQYTTVYAISDESVTNSHENNAGERKLKILYEFGTDKTHPKTFHEILKTDLSMVISHYILVKNYIEAKKYLFSLKNIFNYLWYKPVTYLQILKVLF
ncbi:glycosyltransferase family 2 protein [Mucilaginibacter arboris]|uniref:Glycosyltransferase n=1 Tax=Mucilaginibacter arboris TaxID=2682090 RepID=A0A7K1SY98_9SPHI|nr:glycosyltransferase [Mucilaginibacter arboris]MVN22238.1 glycosyltransferase [Mucilaginibacter arboris]